MKEQFGLKATLLTASSRTVMAGATISPSLPQIQDHFTGTPDAAILSKLILTIPGLVIALSAPLAGLIIDRFGRNKLLVSSLILLNLAPEDFRGRILGGVTTLTFIGHFLSPVFIEPLRSHAADIASGFQTVSWILLSLFLFMGISSRFLDRHLVRVLSRE